MLSFFAGNNEIFESRFDRGGVQGSDDTNIYQLIGKIKILFRDGQYYEGQYLNHNREGQGTHYYLNGDIYDG